MRVRGTRSEAEKKLAQQIAALSTGAIVSSDRQTVAQFLTHWLNVSRLSWAEKTFEDYELIVRCYINPYIGGVQISKLTTPMIQQMYTSLYENGRTKGEGGLSAIAVDGVHRTLRSALGKANDWGLIPRNPASGAQTPKVETKEPRIYNVEQCLALFDAAKSTGRYSLYCAAVLAGMRRNELLGLPWTGGVDFQNDLITVKRQLAKKRLGNNTYKPPKSEKGLRRLPMVKMLREAMLEQWEIEQTYRARPDYTNNDLVWHTPSGEPINPHNLDRQFKRIIKRAGLPDIRFHDLRHSCATMLYAQGVSLKTIQAILGHAQITTTNRYAHENDVITRSALDLVGSAFEDAKNSTENDAVNACE